MTDATREAQARQQKHGHARDGDLANHDRAADDRHGGRQLEARAEREAYRSGAAPPAARFTWSASLQNAQTVPVVTWPHRAHS